MFTYLHPRDQVSPACLQQDRGPVSERQIGDTVKVWRDISATALTPATDNTVGQAGTDAKSDWKLAALSDRLSKVEQQQSRWKVQP